MNGEGNGEMPNGEPPPAIPDILEKGADTREQEPQSANQDIMQFGEEPPKARQDIMMEMLRKVDFREFVKGTGGEEEDSEEE